MKHITLFLALFCSVSTYSQQNRKDFDIVNDSTEIIKDSIDIIKMDTLFLDADDREPNYYYGCWIDKCNGFDRSTANLYFLKNFNGEPYTIALPFYTEYPLTVIGIACGAVKIESRIPENPDDTLAEYFQLYEATDTSFVKVAETRWDTMKTVDKCFEFIEHDHYGNISDSAYVPIYETYFDSAIVVQDSFYVAFTQNNEIVYMDPECANYYFNKSTRLATYSLWLKYPLDSNFIPCMPYGKIKFAPMEGDYYSTHTYDGIHIDTTIWYNGSVTSAYTPIFPIFDTSAYYGPSDTCADVTNFAVLSTDSISALLSWDSSGHNIGWELAYGTRGTTIDSATILETTSTVYNLSQLDSGTWYVAYVRAKCDNGGYSNWSDSIEFYIAGDTVSPISIHTTMLEEYTHLMPNPANDVVTIFSSFSMNRIEVFALNGVLVERMDCEGISSQLTVRDYPKGAYIVKVYTPRGVATKKLVVN